MTCPFFFCTLNYCMATIIKSNSVNGRPLKLSKTLSLRDFYHKRQKILILRSCGGLGDILMHRMIFEDLKNTVPDAEIHFACPWMYHDVVKDHPFIDKVIDSETVDITEYIITYNTSTACGRYELALAPYSGEHRSDIWANHCGVTLKNHNMHIKLTEKEKKNGKKLIEENRDRNGPSVAFCPISAWRGKNLLRHQILGVTNHLHKQGCYVFGLHNDPIMTFVENDIPFIHDVKSRTWMSVIDQADYIISVDTAGFHCAGGMGKPLLGIFTWADGEVYGKYYDCLISQRHRNLDPNWTCGPCYDWSNCPKVQRNIVKPCLTELSPELIIEQVEKMFKRWPR